MKFYSHKSKDFEELLKAAKNIRKGTLLLSDTASNSFFLIKNRKLSLHLFVFGL